MKVFVLSGSFLECSQCDKADFDVAARQSGDYPEFFIYDLSVERQKTVWSFYFCFYSLNAQQL